MLLIGSINIWNFLWSRCCRHRAEWWLVSPSAWWPETNDEGCRISGAEAGLSAGAGESNSNHPNITEMNLMFIEAALITGEIHQSTLSRSRLTCCSMLGVKKDLLYLNISMFIAFFLKSKDNVGKWTGKESGSGSWYYHLYKDHSYL